MYATSNSSDVPTTSYVSRTLFGMSYQLAVAYVTCVVILSVVGTLGNSCLLYIVKEEKQMNKSIRMFMANNAIADLFVAGIAEPMCVVGKGLPCTGPVCMELPGSAFQP